jgi:hypothetical protein
LSKQFLARAALAASGAAFVLVGAAAPAWSDQLKAAGYYGNVDLAIVLTPAPGEYVAGLPASWEFVLVNFGPEFAHGVRMTTTASQALSDGSAAGCVEAAGLPVCTVPGDLLAGSIHYGQVGAVLDPAARGVLAVEARVESDNPDVPDGDEVSAFQMPISAWVDTSATVSCGGGGAPAGLVLDCVVELANAGPSTALAATHRVAPIGANFGSVWTCTARGGAVCAAPIGTGLPVATGDLPPGAALTYRILAVLEGDPDGARVGGLQASIDATSGPQSELEPANDSGAATLAHDLFRDEFE